jgi:hypothetical protein
MTPRPSAVDVAVAVWYDVDTEICGDGMLADTPSVKLVHCTAFWTCLKPQL